MLSIVATRLLKVNFYIRFYCLTELGDICPPISPYQFPLHDPSTCSLLSTVVQINEGIAEDDNDLIAIAMSLNTEVSENKIYLNRPQTMFLIAATKSTHFQQLFYLKALAIPLVRHLTCASACTDLTPTISLATTLSVFLNRASAGISSWLWRSCCDNGRDTSWTRSSRHRGCRARGWLWDV